MNNTREGNMRANLLDTAGGIAQPSRNSLEMSIAAGRLTKTLVELAWQQLHPNPDQPRKEFGLAELEALEESLFERQEIPLIVRPTATLDVFQIVDGERRWRAVQLKGRIKTLWCVITNESLTATDLKLFQITSSVHRATLTACEMWQACVDLLAMNPTWKQQDLAAHLQMDVSSISRYLSPSKCSAAWRDALKTGKVGISDCYEASKLPEEAQAELLTLKLSGASRNDIARAGRKARSDQVNSVKVSSLKVALPGDVSLVIKGAEMDLEGAIEATTEALKAMKKALADGLNSKTAVAYFRDRAKAGGA